VNKDGRPAGKRECRRERERETESGEGRLTGREEGVPERKRERESKF
jgi:hypothetical protein